MKKFLLFILLCASTLTQAAEKQKICLNMIVKDEAPVIERCLASVKPLIDYWVIVDTGSTDSTQAIIKEFMQDIPGELHQSAWVNFEHNRNVALSLAKDKGDYLLFIDADEELVYPSNFTLPPLTEPHYTVIVQNLDETTFARSLLINAHLPWQWKGVIHEYLDSPQASTTTLLPGITNHTYPEGHRSLNPHKYDLDIQTLQEALSKEPNDPRYTFYLAETYYIKGDLQKALETYQKRAQMDTKGGELFWSLYQIGTIQEMLEMDPDLFIDSFVKAYLADNSRAEPLYRIAHHYRMQQKYFHGFIFANFAYSLPPPSPSAGHYNPRLQEEHLPLELSLCAYYMGKYDIAKILSEELLQKPDLSPSIRECVTNNLTDWINPKIKYFKMGTREELKTFIEELQQKGEIPSAPIFPRAQLGRSENNCNLHPLVSP